jgi:hypothetical protein
MYDEQLDRQNAVVAGGVVTIEMNTIEMKMVNPHESCCDFLTNCQSLFRKTPETLGPMKFK